MGNRPTVLQKYSYAAEMSSRRYVAVQKRGVISLPPDVRKRHHLDEPGAQVELSERDDGVIELRPHLAVPADQAWFWSERWQRMEREADADIQAGRTEKFDSVDAFLADLDEE
jgi:bifunctional DNA-binding transcriptional regulator/antitoxin component of YhaV-PrlF toxin-antitoxin module